MAAKPATSVGPGRAISRSLVPVRRSKGLAVSCLVLGLLSLPLSAVILGFPVGLVAIAGGIVVLRRVRGDARLGVEKAVATTGIVAAGIGVVATPLLSSIMVPALLRTNDQMALQDVRYVISEQTYYASRNGGHFDTLECLQNPRACLPDGTDHPPIDAKRVASRRYGHRRHLVLGPTPEGPRLSASSAVTFAYIAVPILWGVTGTRAFCGDQTGAIHVTRQGLEPTVIDGKCADTPEFAN